LRAASDTISKRHCAVIVRGSRAFVRDLRSTNGTFVNACRLGVEEKELKDGDQLRVGPLEFKVALRASVAVDEPTPIRCPTLPLPGDDAAVAALLLEGSNSEPPPKPPDDEVIAATVLLSESREEPEDAELVIGSVRPCPRCGRQGEWIPPMQFRGRFAFSNFRCDGGHTWEIKVQ
jgi:predicted component of type VI protein secretion system